MVFGFRWPLRRRTEPGPGRPIESPRVRGDAMPARGVELDDGFARDFAARATERADTPLLGPWGGLGQTARFAVSATRFPDTLVTRQFGPPAPISLTLPDADEFVASLSSLSSYRNPDGAPGESGSPFTDQLPAVRGELTTTVPAVPTAQVRVASPRARLSPASLRGAQAGGPAPAPAVPTARTARVVPSMDPGRPHPAGELARQAGPVSDSAQGAPSAAGVPFSPAVTPPAEPRPALAQPGPRPTVARSGAVDRASAVSTGDSPAAVARQVDPANSSTGPRLDAGSLVSPIDERPPLDGPVAVPGLAPARPGTDPAPPLPLAGGAAAPVEANATPAGSAGPADIVRAAIRAASGPPAAPGPASGAQRRMPERPAGGPSGGAGAVRRFSVGEPQRPGSMPGSRTPLGQDGPPSPTPELPSPRPRVLRGVITEGQAARPPLDGGTPPLGSAAPPEMPLGSVDSGGEGHPDASVNPVGSSGGGLDERLTPAEGTRAAMPLAATPVLRRAEAVPPDEPESQADAGAGTPGLMSTVERAIAPVQAPLGPPLAALSRSGTPAASFPVQPRPAEELPLAAGEMPTPAGALPREVSLRRAAEPDLRRNGPDVGRSSTPLNVPPSAPNSPRVFLPFPPPAPLGADIGVEAVPVQRTLSRSSGTATETAGSPAVGAARPDLPLAAAVTASDSGGAPRRVQGRSAASSATETFQSRSAMVLRADGDAESPPAPATATPGATGEITAARPDKAAEQDLDKLAEKVWQRIRRMMLLERERRRGMP